MLAWMCEMRVADAEPLEPALVDEPPGTDAFDLLEDAARAGVHLEPRMAGPAPGQVLLLDAVHLGGIARRQLELHAERDLAAAVQARDVVAELHLIPTHALPLAGRQQQVDCGDDLGDEHRARALRRRRQEVQVLPDRTADRARDADIVLEPGPAGGNGRLDDVGDDCPALGIHASVDANVHGVGAVPHDQATHAEVADEDVRPESEDEDRDAGAARRRHGSGEFLRRRGIVQHVGGTADAERGVRSERDIPPEPVDAECRRQGRRELG